jgi:hypothetical protein
MIAIEQFDLVGARIFQPEGPFNNQTPGMFSFKPGTVCGGDFESEYTYVMLNAPVAVTLQQGQLIGWDASFQAYVVTSALARRGDRIGTFFLGGRVGDPGGLPGSVNWPFQITLQPGVYGLWVQRSGESLLQLQAGGVTIPANANLVTTTATGGAGDAPTVVIAGTKLIVGAYVSPYSSTFTANTVSGSAILTNLSTLQGVEVGMGISGTGIPAGCYVQAINGTTVVLGNYLAAGSPLATATNTSQTMTVAKYSLTANSTNGSPVLSNVSNIAGLYPGSVLNATTVGIPAGSTVLSISGNAGSGYQITMSANATSTTVSTTFPFAPINAAQATLVEAVLNWPYIDKTN